MAKTMTLGEFRKLTETYPDELPIYWGDLYMPVGYLFRWDMEKQRPIIALHSGWTVEEEMGEADWQKVLKELDKTK